MKAILVIDMPDGYETDEVLIDYVLHTKGEYKVLRQGGNHEVRPMPKKTGQGHFCKDMQEALNLGWDACIEEIFGENRMKEMTYSDARHREWLAHDTYKGIEFVIMNLGTHPTAYIGVDKNSKLYGESDIDLNVHGGVTYASSRLLNEKNEECLLDKWWIGWDYAHCDDYLPFLGDCGKRWTTREIFEDVKSAIDEILGETE